MLHTFDPRTQEAEVGRSNESKASLGYLVSSRPARTTYIVGHTQKTTQNSPCRPLLTAVLFGNLRKCTNPGSGQVVHKPVLLVSPVVSFLLYSLPKVRLEHILLASVGRGTSFLVMAG